MQTSKNPRRKRIVIISLIVLAVVVAWWMLSPPKTETNETTSYELELERFDKVLDSASDEELFVVLRYAIVNNYVPNTLCVDPYGSMGVEAGRWHRSLMVYRRLSDRKDLLQLIYPDLDVLDDYVFWGQHVGTPYPDTVVAQTIIRNAQGDDRSLDSLMGDYLDENSLQYQFFATPYLWHEEGADPL